MNAVFYVTDGLMFLFSGHLEGSNIAYLMYRWTTRNRVNVGVSFHIQVPDCYYLLLEDTYSLVKEQHSFRILQLPIRKTQL